jgi:hypothetical protein
MLTGRTMLQTEKNPAVRPAPARTMFRCLFDCVAIKRIKLVGTCDATRVESEVARPHPRRYHNRVRNNLEDSVA